MYFISDLINYYYGKKKPHMVGTTCTIIKIADNKEKYGVSTTPKFLQLTSVAYLVRAVLFGFI